MAIYKRILVAVDMSNEAEQVLKKTVELASYSNATIDAIHVVEPVVVETTFDVTPTIDVELEDQLVTRSKSFISGLQASLGMSIDKILVPVGSTKREIHEAAKARGSDLIIVGSHGRHGVGLLLGSTANAILHGAPCDVLSVKVNTE